MLVIRLYCRLAVRNSRFGAADASRGREGPAGQGKIVCRPYQYEIF
jgi:hypothetical protein